VITEPDCDPESWGIFSGASCDMYISDRRLPAPLRRWSCLNERVLWGVAGVAISEAGVLAGTTGVSTPSVCGSGMAAAFDALRQVAGVLEGAFPFGDIPLLSPLDPSSASFKSIPLEWAKKESRSSSPVASRVPARTRGSKMPPAVPMGLRALSELGELKSGLEETDSECSSYGSLACLRRSLASRGVGNSDTVADCEDESDRRIRPKDLILSATTPFLALYMGSARYDWLLRDLGGKLSRC
jgi:hypothetical protein